MNEVVKYNNYLNELKLKQFTNTELDFFMVLCAKMKNLNVQKVTFTFDEIKKLANYSITSKERFIKEIMKMNSKLMSIECTLQNKNKTFQFVLFPIFEIDSENNTLTVSVNEQFKFILNDLVSNFTRFELCEFVNLSSKYSKQLYRFLKQYRTTGVFIVTDIESFKEQLTCPSSYSNKELMRTCITPAIEEIKEKNLFKNLTCTPQRAKKRGSPVIGYVFEFEPENTKIKANNTKPKKQSKKPNKFNNFQQRDINVDELEKMLLQRNF